MQEGSEALAQGVPAPDFGLFRSPGQSVVLHELRGRVVVLAFYPADWEPVSEAQLLLYQSFSSEFERAGTSLFGISVDNVWSHQALTRHLGLGFPLLSDFEPRGRVATMYGVYRPCEGTSKRSLFVIDGDGLIVWSRVYPDEVNPGVDGILRTLEETGQAPPG